MTPEALIVTSDFELCHMVRIAVERFGITAAIALSPEDALSQIARRKFDLVVVDCSELERGCLALRKMRLNPTHRSAVSLAIVIDREHTKYVSDSGANFVIAHGNYEVEIHSTLRSAYGLVLRERGRYNRFPLDSAVTIRCGDYQGEARILNISEGGLCITGIGARLSGSAQLRFTLEAEKSPLQVKGDVVWQRNQHTGVQFTYMTKSCRSDLDAWLARQFEAQANFQRPAIAAANAREAFESESPRAAVYGNAERIHPIVTAIIRGGPVRARCSACQGAIAFGNTISAPLEQERKLREAFLAHVQEKHPADLAEVLARTTGISHSQSNPLGNS